MELDGHLMLRVMMLEILLLNLITFRPLFSLRNSLATTTE